MLKVLDDTLPVHMITDDEIKEFCNETDGEKIKVMWIGHASTLLNIENVIVLMDPVFRFIKTSYFNFN